jgi:hypothetical protein
MKSQTRKFVVEFKSSRRRVAAKSGSIWADMDLKAIVQKAEADAPHLFEPASKPNNGPDTQVPAPTDLTATPNPETDAGVAPPVDHRPNEPAQSMASAPAGTSNEDAPTKAVRLVEQPKKRSKPRAANIKRQRKRMEPARDSIELPVDGTKDELSTLEEENRRLRRMMADHLRRQNTQLRDMLARFGID